MTATHPRSAKPGGPVVPAEERTDRSAEKICVFSHFDRDSIVRRYVFEYVQAIVSAGFSVMFVSTADRVAAEDRERLEALGVDVHVRENRGLDFGSWQYGMALLGDQVPARQLLLANDSVFGPLFDLKFMVDQMTGTDADFWGVTDSYEGGWHLQSYFLCFNENVIRSKAFRDFFARDFSTLPKHQVIVQGEVALSHALLLAGFAGAASCPYGALTEDKFSALCNPTQHYWDELIESHRCPFVKLTLLRDNPNGVENLHRWREVIGRACDYDITLIEDYLAAFGQAGPRNAALVKGAYYLRAIPTALRLALRVIAKVCRHPKGTIMAMETYLATDQTKMPLHPGRRPTGSYSELGVSLAEAAEPGTARTMGERSAINPNRRRA